jgi:hypothetical protein
VSRLIGRKFQDVANYELFAHDARFEKNAFMRIGSEANGLSKMLTSSAIAFVRSGRPARRTKGNKIAANADNVMPGAISIAAKMDRVTCKVSLVFQNRYCYKDSK